MVLNHYIIPTVMYFISCWKPDDQDLKQFTKLCRNFLWGGDPWGKSLPKVKWETVCLPKNQGGLGVHNVNKVADRMAAKWILQSLFIQGEPWAWLLHRETHKYSLQGFPQWKNLLPSTLLFSKYRINPVGSAIPKRIWEAWNKFKPLLVPSTDPKHLAGFHASDSIWWPALELPHIPKDRHRIALKLHNRGLQCWGDLWHPLFKDWRHMDFFLSEFHISFDEMKLLTERMQLWPLEEKWKVDV